MRQFRFLKKCYFVFDSLCGLFRNETLLQKYFRLLRKKKINISLDLGFKIEDIFEETSIFSSYSIESIQDPSCWSLEEYLERFSMQGSVLSFIYLIVVKPEIFCFSQNWITGFVTLGFDIKQRPIACYLRKISGKYYFYISTLHEFPNLLVGKWKIVGFFN